MENYPDRSCDVEIGKSSFNEDFVLQEKVKKDIEELLESADPYLTENVDLDQIVSPTEKLEKKFSLVSNHFQKISSIYKHQSLHFIEPEKETSQISTKRKILLKFTDPSKEDEIFNKDLSEIPEKLNEEILHCKQVIINLLNKSFPVAEQKLLNYLEILYECGLLKIHSDPICLFIQDEETKSLCERIVKLTCISNTLKTYIIRIFLVHESKDLEQFKALNVETKSFIS